MSHVTLEQIMGEILTGADKPAHEEGRLFYDGDEHTLAVYNDEATVTHQLGQEHFNRVYNDTGVTISNGAIVYVSGTEGVENRGTVALARADAKSTSEVIGIATHDIANASFGYVTQMGTVNDLDTSTFTTGDAVYLDETTAGTLRNSPPPEGNFEVLLGYVTTVNATTGRILLNINANLGLPAGDAKELVHDVQKGSAGTITAGQVVYITGYDAGADLPEVELADSSVAGTMPAIGIARDAIGQTTTGTVVIAGELINVDTSTYSVGDELYVSETAGALTSTKPTGAALIQKIAQVTRSHVSFGVIQVFGAGRSNGLPNLPTGNVWLGDGSAVPTATTRSGIDDTAIHDDVAGEIVVITEKVSPVGADVLLIEDSAAGNAKRRVQITNLPGGADADAIHDNVAGEIALITEKTTSDAADLVVIEDSAAANGKRRSQVGNLVTAGGTNVLRVDQSGQGDYTTVAAAISAASGGDVVLVLPGVYTENITLKDDVSLVGLGHGEGDTIINFSGAAANDLVTFSGTSTTFVDNISFLSSFTDAGNHRTIAHTSAGSIVMRNCLVYSTYTNTVAGGTNSALEMTAAGFLVAENCHFIGTRGGSGASAAHRGINVTGAASPTFYGCSVNAWGANGSGIFAAIRHVGTSGAVKMYGGRVTTTLGIDIVEITNAAVAFKPSGTYFSPSLKQSYVARALEGGGFNSDGGCVAGHLQPVERTTDPSVPADGAIWYRSDVDEFRARRNAVSEEIAMVSDLALGDVVGPASSTDNAVARYNLATGKLIQDSGILIDDSDKMSAIETATFNAEHANGTKTAAFTIDWNLGQKQNVTLDATGMVITLTAPPGPGNFLIRMIQNDGTLSTVTWPASVNWPGGTAPTLTNASGAVDIVSMYYDGTNYWAQAGLNFS